MKKCLFVILSVLFVSGFTYSQTNVNSKSPENFVKVSQEMKEAGKLFYVVDMSYFTDNAQKSSFLEKVYASPKVFAASVVKADNTFVVCGYESVVGKDEAIALLNAYRQESATASGQSSTIEKHKAK